MRQGIGKLSVLAVVALSLVCSVSFGQVSAAGGLTISPATLTLSLPAGQTEKTAGFSITNHYLAPAILHFAFEPQAGATDNIKPGSYLTVNQESLTLAPGETARQTITLRGNGQLSPGSHLADLVITQGNSAQADVGVLPSIRMPLIIIKEDGAISAITVKDFPAQHLALFMPASQNLTVHNNGNMIAIPRGTVTVTGPDGSIVSRGVLNLESSAVTPGANINFSANLNKLSGAFWPGIYKISLSYGLGGGQPMSGASSRFFYVAWWHVLLAIAVATGAFYGFKQRPKHIPKKPAAHHPPPHRPILIGRDIS